ncbi:MAG TPA: hypothetical protein VFE96_01155, partial [Candidatus Bathyarchaeia archaeon]|nr:hypothetical protein [Candidatus Bathyarchaeia archaeon]
PNLFTAQQFEVIHCVNGTSPPPFSTACDPSDRVGVVHSSGVVLGQNLGTAPLFGVLFTISYKVGVNSFTNIHFINYQLTYGGASVAQTLPPSDGVYGTPPVPDFTISTGNASLTLPPGSRANASLVLTSRDQFAGKVNLTSTVNPSGISVLLKPNNVTLNNSSARATAIISAVGSSPGFYSVNITATGSSGLHFVLIGVTVKTNADFSIGATPSLLKIAPLSSAFTTIALSSQNEFKGRVNLALVAPPKVNATLSSSQIYLSSDGTNSTSLTVTVPASAYYYSYQINITATGSAKSHVQTVLVTPPPFDLAISANPTALTVQAGQSVYTTISMTSAFYFVGIAYVQASMSGGTAKLNNTSAYLDVGQTAYSKLTVTIDPAALEGSYVVLLTIYSGTQVTHTLGLTLSVSSPLHTSGHVGLPTIFGLPPIVYFGILGLAAAVWVVLSILTYRRSREY